MTMATRPAPAPPRPYHFPRFERRVLGTGLSLLVASMRDLPIVTVGFVTDAAAMSEPDGLDGVASLTARALLEGTARRGAVELTEGLEDLGAAVASEADWDTAGVHVSVLRERLEGAMMLLAEIVMVPTFPEREVERLKADAAARSTASRFRLRWWSRSKALVGFPILAFSFLAFRELINDTEPS